MTTPNPSRSVSPEPTKGERDDARLRAYKRLEAVYEAAGGHPDDDGWHTALSAYVNTIEDPIFAQLAAYIPLVEAAEAALKTAKAEALHYKLEWARLRGGVSMEENVCLEQTDDVVRIQTYDKTVEALLKAMNDLEYRCGAYDWPVFVADGGTYYIVKADRRAALVQVPGQQQADTEQGGG